MRTQREPTLDFGVEAVYLASRPDPRHHDRGCRKYGGCPKCRAWARRRQRAVVRGFATWIRYEPDFAAQD